MNSIPGTHESDRPPLPEGWVYTDDLEWSKPRPSGLRLRRVLVGVIVALVIVCAAGLVVANAQRHYSTGVNALHRGDYVKAQEELAAASLLVAPYRDSAVLEDQAENKVQLDAERTFAADQRESAVATAFESAAAALKARDAGHFTAALVPVAGATLRRVLRTNPDAQLEEQTLARGVATIVENALDAQRWGKAEVWTAALVALRPASPEAEAFKQKVEKGRVLSARLADAKEAVRRGEWRKALRLALGVAAVRKGFPGVSTVVAEARRELARGRARARAAASAAKQSSTTGGSTSSGSTSAGSSSGSTSAPAPP
jgi:hypothetical protein